MTTLGFQFNLKPEEGHGVAFKPTCKGCYPEYARKLKDYLESHYDVEVRTWDDVDYSKPNTVLLFLDYSWRDIRRDKVLPSVPYEKRVLALVEPSNVNPSMYLVPWLRNRFARVATWDEYLLKGNRNYFPSVVSPFEEPVSYPTNRFADIPFDEKKLLIAVCMNRKNYMPWTVYRRRNRVFRYFSKEMPGAFDLYGKGWDDAGFGTSYRGFLDGPKVPCMARYKFALCYENNAVQPGYVSEKIADCICARCVPVYYGSAGIEKRVPRACFIDARQFKSCGHLKDFLLSMTAEEHASYLRAMDAFCQSDQAKSFTWSHHFDCFAAALGLERKY